MSDIDKLVETVARAISSSEGRSIPWEMAIPEARAALAAIEASGTHQIVLVQELHELGAELLGLCDQQIGR